MSSQPNETKTETVQYYYRPLKSSAQVYKCAGCGAEKPEHRAFYVPYFTNNESPSDGFAAGVPLIVNGYQGDQLTKEAAEFLASRV